MRLNLSAVSGLLPLALLSACATHHESAAAPAGLVYECRSGAGTDVSEAMIVFNGQGYQPGNVVRTSAGEVPRSTATLWFRGREHALMADWSYLGLRYRSMEPFEGGRALVWTAEAEDARILSVPAAGDGAETELAVCTRKREPDGGHGGSNHRDTHRR